MRNFLNIAGALSLMLLLHGCGKLFEWLNAKKEISFNWTEDVVLRSSDGITVNRTAKFIANDVAGGGGGSLNKGMTLQIPNGEKPPIVWREDLVPILLDHDEKTGEWIVVATFFHCDEWYRLGRPTLPYAEYRYAAGRWRSTEVSADLVGRKSNLYIADHAPDRPHLTEQDKRLLLNKNAERYYLEIVSKWKTSC